MAELIGYLTRSGRFDVSVLAHVEGPLRAQLEASGAEVHIVLRPHLEDIVSYEATIAEWANRFGRKFDLVVGATWSFPAADMALRLGLPAVMRVGESEPLRTVVSWLYGTLDPQVEEQARRVFAKADAVVSVSHQGVRAYRQAGFDARYAVLSTGVDIPAARRYRESTDRAQCRRSLGVGTDERLLVCAASIWPVKGQAVLVSALGALAQRSPHLTCALIGESGPHYASAIAEYAAGVGLADRVRILAYCDDLRPWWRAADVVVCASETEALPSSVLEGMAYELPVLACRVGDIPRLVEEGRNGWLCDPFDLGSMVEALARAGDASDDTVASMGSASYRAVAPYDKAANLALWELLLAQVAAGATPSLPLSAYPQGAG